MNNTNNIILNILDTVCSNCYKKENNNTITLEDNVITQNLQNNYTLNVLGINDNLATILIQNGNYVIIRIIPFATQTSILIPNDNNITHIVTLELMNKQ